MSKGLQSRSKLMEVTNMPEKSYLRLVPIITSIAHASCMELAQACPNHHIHSPPLMHGASSGSFSCISYFIHCAEPDLLLSSPVKHRRVSDGDLYRKVGYETPSLALSCDKLPLVILYSLATQARCPGLACIRPHKVVFLFWSYKSL